MDNTTLVYASPEPFDKQSLSTSLDGQSSAPSPQRRSSSSQQTVAFNGLQSIRESFQQRAISSKATNIILQSWSTGTQKQYVPYIKKWHDFCSKWKVNPYNPPLNTVLDILVSLHEQGLSYTNIKTARRALSAIILPTDNVNVGSHPIVSRFMKGIFKNNPPASRYRTTWGVSPVVSYLLSLPKPTQSKVPSVLLQVYPADQSLCVFTHLKEYLQRTKLLRGNETKLFLSHAKPHHRASRDTISSWIPSVMAEAGV